MVEDRTKDVTRCDWPLAVDVRLGESCEISGSSKGLWLLLTEKDEPQTTRPCRICRIDDQPGNMLRSHCRP